MLQPYGILNTKSNINKLEKCQRRTARFMNGDYSKEKQCYIYAKGTKMVNKEEPTQKMVMMYRIVHHLIAIPSQMYLTTATTRGHAHQIPNTSLENTD